VNISLYASIDLSTEIYISSESVYMNVSALYIPSRSTDLYPFTFVATINWRGVKF